MDVYLEEELESGVLPERAEAEVLVTFKGPKLDSAAKIRKELELPLSIAAQLPPERFSGVSIFPDVSADFSSAEFRGVCPPCRPRYTAESVCEKYCLTKKIEAYEVAFTGYCAEFAPLGRTGTAEICTQ